MNFCPPLLLLLGFASVLAAEPSGPENPAEPFRQVFSAKGIQVAFEAVPLAGASHAPREGDPVRFRFTLTDAAGKTPIRGANARAWLDLRRAGEIPAANAAEVKAGRFITGGIFGQATMDLNSYTVLALNGDATISVVDPLFGFGNSKLLTLIPLSGNGFDWALSADQARLFVSIPEKGQIAVIDTTRWEVIRSIDAGLRPARLALQPDGQNLWVTGDGSSATSAAAFRADTFAAVARLTVGRGRHDIRFSGDSARVFVTNSEDDSVTVIDSRRLLPVADIKVGARPVAAAYSDLAGALYVCESDAGQVTVIDARTLAPVKVLRLQPGLADIGTAPGGRYVLTVNAKTDSIHVIDTASAETIQTGTLGRGPYQISFSSDLAYVNHLGSSDVFMLPLAQIGDRGKPLSVVTFPAGRQPLGEQPPASPAARIVPLPGEGAVLVAGTRDREVFFYKEGMAAPMGSFTNYGHEPMAVEVVDRSLRERGAAGVYETVTKAGPPGLYDVVFFLDSPKIIHGFELPVADNPALESDRNAPRIVITPVAPEPQAMEGAGATFRFRAADKKTNQPVTGLSDLVIVIMTAGNWHQREVAKEQGGGVYSVTVTPPGPGDYYAHAQCLSANVDFGSSQYPVLRLTRRSSEAAATR